MKRLWIGIAAAVLILIGIFWLGNHGNKPTAPNAAAPEIDGIPCQSEMVKVHWHAHLALLNSGQSVEVPAGIGINQSQSCLYWLHTHQTDGIIHIESPDRTDFTLGNFFNVWGQPLSDTQAGPLSAPSGQKLSYFLNGQPYTGDPKAIVLHQHDVITVEAGTQVPPPSYTFPQDL